MTKGSVRILLNGKSVCEETNKLTNLYRNYITRFLSGETVGSIYCAIGLGSGSPQVTDIVLETELHRKVVSYRFTRLSYYSRMNTLWDTLTPPIPPGSSSIPIREIGLFDAGPIEIENSGFETWNGGTPTPWQWTGNITVSKGTVDYYEGSVSAELISTATNEKFFQYIGGSPGTPAGTPSFADLRGSILDFRMPLKCGAASTVKIYIDDGVNSGSSSFHSGGSAFEILTASRLIDDAASKCEIGVVFGTPGTANADWANLVDRGNLLARANVVVNKGSGEAMNVMWEIFQEEFV